jgi:hypothetical protein
MTKEISHDEMKMISRKILIESGDHLAGWLIHESIKELELFLNTIENFIEKEEKRDIENFNEYLKTIPEGDREEFLADCYPYQWEQVLGNHLRNSFLVTIMSITEDSLNRICTQITTMVDSAISNSDLKGSILEASKKYLQAMGNFKNPSEHHWANIIDMYKLRNVIVHNGGILEGAQNEKRIRAFMKKAPGITNPSTGVLKLDKEFCLYAIDQVKDFFAILDLEQNNLRNKLKSWM